MLIIYTMAICIIRTKIIVMSIKLRLVKKSQLRVLKSQNLKEHDADYVHRVGRL